MARLTFIRYRFVQISILTFYYNQIRWFIYSFTFHKIRLYSDKKLHHENSLYYISFKYQKIMVIIGSVGTMHMAKITFKRNPANYI